MASKPLILFIDAYDSFANNIVSLLETSLDVTVRKIQIDNPILKSDEELHNELRNYTAVVCGPGPGHPANENDIGIMRKIWRLNQENILPVLGICLGFQSLCLEFGGKIKQLHTPQHGIPRKIVHTGISGRYFGKTIFDKVNIITATHYHSLCVDVGQDDGKYSTTTAWNAKKWSPFRSSPDLVPLAWVEDPKSTDSRVLMAVSHYTKPFWGLQYHPESICTDASSKTILQNWYRLAKEWNKAHRTTTAIPRPFLESDDAIRRSLLGQFHDGSGPLPAEYTFYSTRTTQHPGNCIYYSRAIKIPSGVAIPDIIEAVSNLYQDQILLESSNSSDTSIKSAGVRGRYTIIGMEIEDSIRFEYFLARKELIVHNPEAAVPKETINFEKTKIGGVWPFLAKWVADRKIDVEGNRSPFLGGLMGYTSYEMGLESIGVAPKSKHPRRNHVPDLCFAWVNRSLVIDHWENVLYVQCLEKPNNKRNVNNWMDETLYELSDVLLSPESFSPYVITMSRVPRTIPIDVIKKKFLEEGRPEPVEFSFDRHNMFGVVTARYKPEDKPWTFIEQLHGWQVSQTQTRSRIMHNAGNNPQLISQVFDHELVCTASIRDETTSPNRLISSELDSKVFINVPVSQEYEDKVRQCQKYIRSGDSYELCLTDQTEVRVPRGSSTPSSWELYKTLRQKQPAPFASYIKLGAVTLISASPERFLKWNETGKCELRPMKGTVKKSESVLTREQAQAILHTPKERAELLMIIDLIRHDLHGICGSGNVSVSKLFSVEEYKSVFQMVAVVEGQIPPPVSSPSYEHRREAEDIAYTGIDVLAASLPPGSMTGAPKKRSCQILQEIEGGKDRGLYSGVVGYMDVAGRGDWSVNIRCAYKFDDPIGSTSTDTWDKRFEDLFTEAVVSKAETVSDSSSSDISGTSTPVKKEYGTGYTSHRSSLEIPIVDTWHIGAGGAVTWLSTPEGEREEMLTKLKGTLGVFTD